ncbi:acyl-CoA dehydrogenase family protein [Streptomyces griseoflavus]|uniref:acyl-CoA dehydrogenase family protein n=1 Tax=Streptomyces griseoflavus TaxID=35619 RepID=UPI00167DAB39|nr:acyl-CoA dehydrogenase family protein [Streptomyces griseoflavus]GGV45006.1 acyl-CoA dehydrogenase [Streptomyces griseoflavus]
MLTADIPTRAQLVQRAAEVAPLLRANASKAEDAGRLQDETIEALAGAGVFRLRTPKRYGGYEADTRTLVDVAAELARGDGAAAWTASVYWIPTFMACLFPDSVQDEVFATPDVRICGTLSPSAQATPVEGGIVVNGKWSFVSGAPHAHWQEIIAAQEMPHGQHLPLMALVPMDQLEIVDDWDTSGLRGTGSVSTVARDLFVPQERVMPLPAVLSGQYASQLNADTPAYRAPLLPVAAASSVGTAVGLARAAQDAFFERLPGRTLTYTWYAKQAEAAVTHLQASEAVLKADQAEFHAHRLAGLVDSKAASGEEWTVLERARARADLGTAVRLAKESVDIFASASGGSSVYRDVPIQRITRDIQAITLHALMNPATNAELYGRVLCGQQPNTLYI